MTMPFRFGLVAMPRSRPDWLGFAQRVEDLGFDALLVPDNLDGAAPFVACAAAAAVTKSLVVGPYVLATPLRTPGLVAAEAASLDMLAEGRIDLGLGAGRPDSRSEAARLGLRFGSPAERVSLLADTVAAVRERVPHVRVTVAAAGPRMLQLAGREADVVALGASPLADEQELVRMAGIATRAAGHRAGQVVLNLNLTAVGDDIPAWLTQRLGSTIGALQASNAAGILRGSARQMALSLQRIREATGISYFCAGADHAERLAPVVALLRGQ